MDFALLKFLKEILKTETCCHLSFNNWKYLCCDGWFMYYFLKYVSQ